MGLRTALLISAVGSLLAGAAAAQSWPNKPVRVIVGFNAGTSPDLVVRITGAEISKRLGQQFIVENRAGAGGLIAVKAVAQAEADGYTLLSTGSMINAHPIFLKDGPLVVGKDLTPIADVARTPYVAIARTSVAKSWQELLDYAKKNPNKLNFGSQTTQIDVLTEWVKLKSGLTYTPVRYKGAPVQEILRGDVDFYVGTMSGLAPHVQAGKLAPVLFFGKHPDYPNVPTATELGLLKTSVGPVFGYYGPRGLARDIAQKLAQAAREASKSTEVVEAIRKLGLEAFYQGPDEQLRDYQAVVAVFAEAARLLNIQPQ